MSAKCSRFLVHAFAFFLCVSPEFALGESDHPPSDGETLAIFDQFNTLEIAVARTAIQRARRDDVRSLGQTIVREQEAQQREGRKLGRRLKIYAGPPPNELGSYKQTVSRLMSVPAEEFDRVYLKQQLAIERNAIDALSGEMPSVKDPELAKFLRDASDRFRLRREATQALSERLESR